MLVKEAVPTGSLGNGINFFPLSQELRTAPGAESTNDISYYLGMLDPWYERNVLGLMHLPPEVLCQVSCSQGGRDRGSRAAQRITQNYGLFGGSTLYLQ